LFTSTITTVTARVAVALGGIFVGVDVSAGMGVPVSVGRRGVPVGVTVDVSVGKGVGMKGVEVGNGVKVGKSKLNSGVGVGGVPVSVRTIGLAGGVAAVRGRNSVIVSPQRQHRTRRTEPGRRIFSVGPSRK
jgi:hypothetical protein